MRVGAGGSCQGAGDPFSAWRGNWKLPATIPGTVMSSSSDSQRNANPFNPILTSFS